MCRPVTCATCGKTTWAGCGRHVDQVMDRVPRAHRCAGHADETPDQQSSFLRRLLGRS